MNYKDYLEALTALWNKYQNESNCPREFTGVLEKLKETLKLGIGICRDYKPNVDLLWMGINPSCTDNERIEHPFPTFEETLEKDEFCKGYWKTVKRIIMGCKCTKEHLDLFAIRKTPQDFLRKVGVNNENNPALHFLVEHLWYTQQFLENYLKPKVIVLANKTAGAYLGLDQRYVWMGYDTKVIDELELPCGKVHKIIGISEKEEGLIRPKSKPYKNELDGTLILHARFQGNGCPKEQQINPNHIEELLKLAGVG